MRRILTLLMLCSIWTFVRAQHVFQNTSLSEALIDLDKSSEQYSISFVYDELEDFIVSKTVRRGCSLPDAVREVCGYYPIHVSIKDKEIFVECIQKDKKKLIGRLVGPNNNPVAYANIFLYNPSDSTMINGGISNEAGDFVIPCSAVQARVRISCMGFKTIERQMPISKVGIIRMEMETNYLDNVIVNGRMPVIRSEADRLLYIVSNDEFAKGHSAFELMSRVPLVCMEADNVLILGKGPAKFMLNGRVSEMGGEAIQQKLWTMRAEDIERIEVISIPSGRYQTDMGSGYINIVLRRDQTLGWRGDMATQTGISDDWSGRVSGSLNFASKTFDIMADVNGSRSTQTTDNKMAYRLEQVGDILSDTQTKKTEEEIAANLTLRYLPFKALELGAMLSWQVLWPEKIVNGKISSAGDHLNSEAGLTPDDNTCTRSIIAYCDWRLDSKGKVLSLSCHDYKKDDDGRSFVCSKNNIIYTQEDYHCYFDYHIQSFRADLKIPFDIATIDAGASYSNIRNQAITEHDVTATYINRLVNSRNLDYRENTKAAYLSIYRDWDRFTFKAGLRYEHIDWDEKVYNKTDLTSPNIRVSRDYWLPWLNFSFKQKEGQLISLSWGMNSVRPNFYDLNPIVIYKTVVESAEGNPTLKPSRTSKIELSYHNLKGLYVCSYFHHASNVVEPFTTTVINREDDNVLNNFRAHTFYSEIGRYNRTGIYLHYQRPLTRHLQVTAEGDVYYHDFEIVDSVSILGGLHGWGKHLAISSDWYLNDRHTLLLSARYQHRFSNYAGMTKTDSYGYFNFSLRYSMFNDRLKFSLVANDPFRQFVTDETISYCRFAEELHTNHHAHYIGFTAAYSFGGKKVRRFEQDKRDTESQRAIRKR